MRAARIARLATTNAAGGADLVPIVFALLGDDTLVSAIDHKPKTTTGLARLGNIRANPEITVLVDHYDEDWSALWWVRMRAAARVIEAGEPGHREAIDALATKYVQYAERRPDGPVIWAEITGWRSWRG